MLAYRFKKIQVRLHYGLTSKKIRQLYSPLYIETDILVVLTTKHFNHSTNEICL